MHEYDEKDNTQNKENNGSQENSFHAYTLWDKKLESKGLSFLQQHFSALKQCRKSNRYRKLKKVA
jgi:hypothetical protein